MTVLDAVYTVGKDSQGATPVGLMNGVQLVNLLIENNIVIRQSEHALIERSEERL
mgnify:CR=1 FL=1